MTDTNALLFVVDDDDAVRDSLKVLLSNKGLTVETFADGESFLSHVETLDRPACVLLDLRMPGPDGLSILQKLTELSLPPRIIMITGHGDVATAVKAMKLGAFDFIEKPFSQEVILDVVTRALNTFENDIPKDADAQAVSEKLSRLLPRERDVMARLVDGLTNKEIARDLDISPRTVEVYRAGVMDKMDARNLSSLVRMGLAVGLGS